MGWGVLGKVGKALESGVKSVGGAIEDGADAVSDKLNDTWDSAKDAAEDSSDFIEGMSGAVVTGGGGWLRAAGSYAGSGVEWAADAADDYVLDTVDDVTFGVVDFDYDGGSFSGSVGIDDIATVSVAIGDDGVSTSSDVFGAGAAFGVSGDGIDVSMAGGIQGTGFLPYGSFDVEIGADGAVVIEGEVEGMVPTPVGILVGGASGGFARDTDGNFVAVGSAEGSILTVSGVAIEGAVDFVYADFDDTTVIGVNVSGGVDAWVVSARGGVGYAKVETDEGVAEEFRSSVSVEVVGAEAGVIAEHTSVETDGSSTSGWETDAFVEGLDAESISRLGSALFGGRGATIPGNAHEIVTALSDGDTQELLDELGDVGGVDALVGSLESDDAAALLIKVASDGTTAQMLNQLGSATATEVMRLAAESDSLDAIVESLSESETTDLIRTLVQPGPSTDSAPERFDVIPSEPIRDWSESIGSEPIDDAVEDGVLLDDVVDVSDPGGTGAASDDAEDDIAADSIADVLVAGSELNANDDVMPEATDPDLESRGSAFVDAVQATDDLEESVDDLFDGIDG